MSEPLSPYALLRASKPKPAPTIVTPYDLYSAAQSADAYAPQQRTSPPAPPVPAPPASAPRRPAPYLSGKTHYIADIKARHNQALRRSAPFQNP